METIPVDGDPSAIVCKVKGLSLFPPPIVRPFHGSYCLVDRARLRVYILPTCHSSPQLGVSSMSSPGPPALQRLHHLNRSPSGFHDELSNILYGEEYQKCVPNLQGDDVVWIVEYLAKVRYHVVFPHSLLTLFRLSMILILPVPPFESVYANSEEYAVPRGCFQSRTRSRLVI